MRRMRRLQDFYADVEICVAVVLLRNLGAISSQRSNPRYDAPLNSRMSKLYRNPKPRNSIFRNTIERFAVRYSAQIGLIEASQGSWPRLFPDIGDYK